MTKRDSQLREYASEASDIVTRLRDRAYSFKAPDPLIEEAATEIEVQRACTSAARAEIERLRNGALSGCEKVQQQPVAWGAFFKNGEVASVCWSKTPIEVIPLYRSPTLTPEERKAIEHFAREFKGARAATLRSLLERL